MVDSHHIIRFHALRPQVDMTPWQLQINLRDDEVWRIMGLLTNSTVWVLLGMQVKCHNQQLSKPAAMLQDWLHKATPQKGRGKGHKGNTSPSDESPLETAAEGSDEIFSDGQHGHDVLCQ